jgi:hypothetical protein
VAARFERVAVDVVHDSPFGGRLAAQELIVWIINEAKKLKHPNAKLHPISNTEKVWLRGHGARSQL